MAGIPTDDMSAIPTARLHLRHVVGGMLGDADHPVKESLYEVDVPERNGTIRRWESHCICAASGACT